MSNDLNYYYTSHMYKHAYLRKSITYTQNYIFCLLSFCINH